MDAQNFEISRRRMRGRFSSEARDRRGPTGEPTTLAVAQTESHRLDPAPDLI
jgi:hypothetical protein